MSRILLAILLLAQVCVATSPAHAATRTVVGSAGDRFTLNGRPTFLLGVSYFDARFWRVSDLDGLQRRGFNLIRIWLDWRDHSFFDRNGALALEHRQTLLDLVDAAGQRGMIVEVAILDTDVSFGKDKSVAAVRAAGTALKQHPNVLYDLVNEHDHASDTFSTRQIAQLAQALRESDPDAIFMVSSTTSHLIDAGLRLRQTNIKDDVNPPVSAQVLAPHLPRTSTWYAETDKRIAALKGYLRAIGRDVPVYLNEEARRGHSGLNPTVEQFVQAAREARAASAAAWLFHTDAGFALNDQSFFASLDSVEHRVVDTLAAELGIPAQTAPASTTPLPAEPAPQPSEGAVVARINAGGEVLTVGGERWSADVGFSGGNRFATRSAIGGTEADALYQTERVGRAFRYQIPVPASGTYQVRLHFAEIFWTRPGQRVFDVNLEGGPVELDNFDIVAAVGPRIAVIKSFLVPVRDGALTIDFHQAGPDRPKISAIEVLTADRVPSATQPSAQPATPAQPPTTPATIPTAPTTAPSANGPAFYVATTGDDRQEGSAQRPWRSIDYAIDRARPGDTIYVRAGTYREVVSVRTSGTRERWITLRAAPGETVTIDGSGKDLANGVIDINKVAYVRVDGFQLRATQGESRGFKVRNSHDVIGANLDVRELTEGGVRVEYSDRVTLDRLTVTRVALSNRAHTRSGGWPCAVSSMTASSTTIQNSQIFANEGEGICIFRNSPKAHVIGNTIFDNWGVNLYLDGAPEALVERNLVYETNRSYIPQSSPERRSIAYGIAIADEQYRDAGYSCFSKNGTIRNNIVLNTRIALRYYRGDTSYVPCSGFKGFTVEHNTLVFSWDAGIAISAGHHAPSTIRANVVVARGDRDSLIAIVDGTLNGGAVPIVFRDNVFYQPGGQRDGFVWKGRQLGFDGWSHVVAQAGGSANSFVDPQFSAGNGLNPASFRLASGSPAQGRAPARITHDFFGTPRPAQGQHDAGAVES